MSLYDEAEKSRQKRLMEEAAKLHAIAVEIIANALADMIGMNSTEQDRYNAAAIIARLAGNDPPILLAYADEIKD